MLAQDVRSTQGQDDDEDVERPTKRPKQNPGSCTATHLREVGLMRKDGDENYASFLGSASGIHFIRSVYAAIGDKDAPTQAQDQAVENNLVPGEDDRLSSETSHSFDTSLWQTSETTPSDAREYRCSFDDMLAWSQSYFDNWHPAFPFLHAPSVLQIFENLSNGHNTTVNSEQHMLEMAIVRSIISISLADRRQTGKSNTPVPSALVFVSFRHAVDSVQLALSTKTSVVALQAVVSVQLFLTSMLRHNAASRLGGLVTRMAYHLGLHRCPVRYPAFTEAEIQLRQRLFWSIYCIDRHICQSLGLPVTLRDDDIDVCFLDQERHSPRASNPAGNVQPQKAAFTTVNHLQELDERLQLLNILSKQAEVKGLIIEFLHKSIPYRQTNDHRCQTIKMKLTKWSNDIEAYLDIDNGKPKPLSGFHEMMLGILKHECIIALNRPSLASPKKDMIYRAALQTCVAAARFVIMTLHGFLEKASESADDPQVVTSTPLLWPSFTWAVWMSAFILIYAGFEEAIQPRVAIRLTERGLRVLRHLSLRGSVWPNACEVAIRELRTRLEEQQSKSRLTSEDSRAARRTRESIRADQIVSDSSSESRTISQNGVDAATSVEQSMPQEHESPVYVSQNDTNLRPQHRRHRVSKHATSAPAPIQPSSAHVSAYDWQYQRFNQEPTSGSGGISAATASTPGVQSEFLSGTFDSLPLHETASWLPNSTFPAVNNVDLFQGFEIPFWMGDDQYTNLMGT